MEQRLTRRKKDGGFFVGKQISWIHGPQDKPDNCAEKVTIGLRHKRRLLLTDRSSVRSEMLAATRANRLILAGQRVDHAIEDEMVQRQHGIPVKPAGNAARTEGGSLDELVAVLRRDDLKFQPRLPGQAHLGK